jgi:hypothetical protein
MPKKVTLDAQVEIACREYAKSGEIVDRKAVRDCVDRLLGATKGMRWADASAAMMIAANELDSLPDAS